MARTKAPPRGNNGRAATRAPQEMGTTEAGDSTPVAGRLSAVSGQGASLKLLSFSASFTSMALTLEHLSGSISIPLEIFGEILDELLDEKEFLLQCRLLSKDLLEVANPRAFRRLSVWCTGDAAKKKGYFNVANTAGLALYVKEITWKEETGTVDADAMQAFSDSITSILKFSNVDTLRFCFQPSWNEPFDNDFEMSPTRQLQIRIFNDLASLYSSSLGGHPKTTLKHLEIRGLITMPNESLRSDAFKALVQPIEKLAFSLVTNDGEDFYHSDDNYSAFLETDLTGLLNSARNLTSFTLESDIKTFYDWSKVATLPSLRHLKLNNFVFGHLFSPEEFILRHKASINHLDLIECSLDIDPYTQLGGPAKARVWKDVFENFENELMVLEDVVFEPLPGIEEDDGEFHDINGYVWLDTEGGYKNGFEADSSPLEGDGEEDRNAYESWKKAVENRLLGL